MALSLSRSWSCGVMSPVVECRRAVLSCCDEGGNEVAGVADVQRGEMGQWDEVGLEWTYAHLFSKARSFALLAPTTWEGECLFSKVVFSFLKKAFCHWWKGGRVDPWSWRCGFST